MIIKQYVVGLPADYDMGLIRARVDAKGSAFDHFPGLGLKCFLIRERNLYGAESNQYAPIYLWPQVQPMWGFIAGDGFAGILDSFGWTPIDHWFGMAVGLQLDFDPRRILSVTRRLATVEPGTDLRTLRDRTQVDTAEALSRTDGLLIRAIGFNPQTWSLAQFDYWERPPDDLSHGNPVYTVLHVSAPGLADLRHLSS